MSQNTISKAKILVVEDEFIIWEWLRNSLNNLGYETYSTYFSGNDLLNLIFNTQDNLPDLILMDINLSSSLNGVQIANMIWKKYNIPIIYITAYLTEDEFSKLDLYFPYAYLIKPYRNEDLKKVIDIGLYIGKLNNKIKQLEEKIKD